MPDWLMTYLGSLQGTVVHHLAAELRAGGVAMFALSFMLGAIHALTPGHGKTALAAYFLGREARIGKGLRVAVVAAFLHVLSGFFVFLVLRFLIGQLSSVSGRPSSTFMMVGYSLIIVAGTVMLLQSLRPDDAAHDEVHALTAGVGLLPCPLTISVLGFAWTQGTTVMAGLVLLSLALGISATIGMVAVLAIVVRNTVGIALAEKLPRIERGARILQGLAGMTIIAIGIFTMTTLGS